MREVKFFIIRKITSDNRITQQLGTTSLFLFFIRTFHFVFFLLPRRPQTRVKSQPFVTEIASFTALRKGKGMLPRGICREMSPRRISRRMSPHGIGTERPSCHVAGIHTITLCSHRSIFKCILTREFVIKIIFYFYSSTIYVE